MSWEAYIKGFLTEKPDYVNMITQAGIFSQQGAKCAAAGKEPSTEEIKKLVEIVAGRKGGDPAVIGGEKLQQICMWEPNDEIHKAYFKKQGGGLCVALTNTLIIYGFYEVSKKGKCKGADKAQNQGDAATLVEGLAEYLCGVGS